MTHATSSPFSTSIFWRCVPDAVPGVAEKTASAFFEGSGASSLYEEIVTDVSASWREIIYMCLVAFGLSIVVTILFRFLAAVIVYIIVALIAFAAFIGPLICWYIWYSKKQDYDSKNGINLVHSQPFFLGRCKKKRVCKTLQFSLTCASNVGIYIFLRYSRVFS